MSRVFGSEQIRRQDIELNGPSRSRSTSPDLEAAARLQARLAALYGDVAEEELDQAPQAEKDFPANAKAVEPEDETFAFRLFSSKTKAAHSSATKGVDANIQKITLESNAAIEEAAGNGGILGSRPLSHYLTSKSHRWDHIRNIQFSDASVAVSGSWILTKSSLPNPGLYQPWRVRHLRISRREFMALEALLPGTKTVVTTTSEVKSKNKPNKKRRIMLRTRQRKKEASRYLAAKAKEAKEIEEREKRTRRNREKKVKKKEKEKAKKAEAKALTAEDEHMDVDS